jgi:hypothetical protein
MYPAEHEKPVIPGFRSGSAVCTTNCRDVMLIVICTAHQLTVLISNHQINSSFGCASAVRSPSYESHCDLSSPIIKVTKWDSLPSKWDWTSPSPTLLVTPRPGRRVKKFLKKLRDRMMVIFRLSAMSNPRHSMVISDLWCHVGTFLHWFK